MKRLLPIGTGGSLVLAGVAVMSLLAFAWPLLIRPSSSLSQTDVAPLLFALVLPLVAAAAVTEVASGLDPKRVAMLGVLTALGAALRPLGAGVAGIEPIFFLIVLGGRVFGPGFGFLLGTTTLATSALLTAGIGPWLPYQMLAAAFVGLGAGLLPHGRRETMLLACYGAVASVLYGLAMNLSFWPFLVGPDTEISFVAGAPLAENLRRFLLFSIVTSLGWELGRAITTATLITLVGGVVLRVLRRASHRAAFDAVASFDQVNAT